MLINNSTSDSTTACQIISESFVAACRSKSGRDYNSDTRATMVIKMRIFSYCAVSITKWQNNFKTCQRRHRINSIIFDLNGLTYTLLLSHLAARPTKWMNEKKKNIQMKFFRWIFDLLFVSRNCGILFVLLKQNSVMQFLNHYFFLKRSLFWIFWNWFLFHLTAFKKCECNFLSKQ